EQRKGSAACVLHQCARPDVASNHTDVALCRLEEGVFRFLLSARAPSQRVRHRHAGSRRARRSGTLDRGSAGADRRGLAGVPGSARSRGCRAFPGPGAASFRYLVLLRKLRHRRGNPRVSRAPAGAAFGPRENRTRGPAQAQGFVTAASRYPARKRLLRWMSGALAAVEPSRCVAAALGNWSPENVAVLALGKAAAGMADGA